MIIYLDVLILKEMVINYLIIFLTGKLTGTKSSKRIFGAFIATLYTIGCFVEPKLSFPIFRVLSVALIICISLKVDSLNDMFNKGIMFYFVTFFVAGIISYKADSNMQTIYLVSTIIVVIRFIRMYKEKFMLQNYFCDLEIPKLDIKIKVLIDSGHFLKGSSGEEVIVVSPNVYVKLRGRGKETSIRYKTIDKEVPQVRGIKITDVKIEHFKKIYKYDEVIFIKSNSAFNNYEGLISMRFLNLEKESEDKNGNLVFN